MSGLGRLILGTLLAGVLVAGLLLPMTLGVGLAANSVTNAIEDAKSDPLDGDIPLRTTFTDASGAPIATIYDQNRVNVPLSSISDYLQVAVISMEDRRFYQHQGVDWRGTVRALLRNAQADTTAQGGSTLTQQYVKNYLYLVQAKTEAEKADAIASTPIRKLREAKVALSLEQTHTKAEILERYLNLVAFGPSQYGAEAASQWYFGVSADKLTLAQAALLAGMVNNPPKYNPLDENHVQDARDRRDLVLDVMVAAGRLSKATAEETKQQDLGLNPQRVSSGCIPAVSSDTNGFFCQYVLDYLNTAGFDNKTVARAGWTVKTTLDPAVMASAKAAAVANADPNNDAVKRIANAVAVVSKDEPRRVLALAANRPYGLDPSKGQTVQRLTTTFAPLGAGSTFKIFTAAAAMEAGLGTNAVIDSPPEYTSPLAAKPFKNAGTYPASMTLAQALATSPNTAFVALEDQVGLQKVADMAVRLGLKGYALDAGDRGPGLRQRRHGLHHAGGRAEDRLVHPRRVAGQPARTGQRGRHPRLRRPLVPADPGGHHHRPQRQVRHLGQDALRRTPFRPNLPARSRWRWRVTSPPTARRTRPPRRPAGAGRRPARPAPPRSTSRRRSSASPPR